MKNLSNLFQFAKQPFVGGRTSSAAGGTTPTKIVFDSEFYKLTAGTATKVGKFHKNEDIVVNLLCMGDVTCEGIDPEEENQEKNDSPPKTDKKMSVSDIYYAAIFDGHGGLNCAKFLSINLHLEFRKLLEEQPVCRFEELEQILCEAFSACERKFASEHPTDTSGSCGMAAIAYNESCFVAWVGDCRAVAASGNEVVQISRDHSIMSKDERKRIVEKGGFIQFNRMGGVLTPSRAFGDLDLKRTLLNGVLDAEPSIEQFTIDDNEGVDFSFLILATDGVWEAISNEDACNIISKSLKKSLKVERAATKLVEEASKISGDDVSCCVIVWQKNERKLEQGSLASSEQGGEE